MNDRKQTRKLTQYTLRLGSLLAVALYGSAAFAQTNSTITPITVPGTISLSVLGLNAGGQVTGYLDGNSGPRAFRWTGGTGVDLGTLGGSISVGYGLNNLGHVAGYAAAVGDTEFHAYVAIGQSLFDLGTLGGSVSAALAINDSGQSTGYSYLASGDSHAFIFSGGTMFDLGTLGGSFSSGAAINSAGQVAGDASTANNSENHAFLFSSGAMRDLGTLGGTYSSASAVNSSGHVVGDSTLQGDADTHAFFYDGTSLRDLGTLGGNYSTAYAINDAGQVIGDSSLVDGYRGFIYSSGVLRDLGSLGGNFSSSWGLNALGQVVGVSSNASFRQRAFLWQNGTMTDLNSLLPANSGWELTGAFFINDRGHIVGNGLFQGQPAWYLMTLITQQNQSPVANAGSDQFVNCNGGVGQVVLDGSASSDPDGDALSFEWRNGSTVIGSVVTATVSLSVGSHTVTLRVTDSHGASSEDNVNVVVGDTIQPVVTCPSNREAAANSDGIALVPDFRAGLVASDNCTAASALAVAQSPAAGTAVRCGIYTVLLTVADAAGNRTTCSATFTVVDVTSPVVRCPENLTLEANAQCRAAVPDLSSMVTAVDNCTPPSEIRVTQTPSAGTQLEKGTHEVVVTVTDASGNAASCTTSVTVVDRARPHIVSLQASETVLAPPNRQMVPITLTVVATDNCDPNPVCRIASVTSSEPVTGDADWRITGNLTLELRAELDSKDTPRIYTIKVCCTDASGNSSCKTVQVMVAKNKKVGGLEEALAKLKKLNSRKKK
jgi:probable HAF family extracellular repeat protein